MIDTVVNAAVVAIKAHYGQRDKGGRPYLCHVMHVASRMYSEDEIVAALLHDVVEDSYYTFADLDRIFPPRVVQAVKALTRAKIGESYLDYIERVTKDDLAVKVKLADLRHNADLTRIA